VSRDVSPLMKTCALTEVNTQDGFSHYEERANNRTVRVGLLRPALRLNSAYVERTNTKGYKTKRATERKACIIDKPQCSNSSTRSQQLREPPTDSTGRRTQNTQCCGMHNTSANTTRCTICYRLLTGAVHMSAAAAQQYQQPD
jgi:hypothetical protein